MSPTLISSLLAGFLVGVVLGLILLRVGPPRQAKTSREEDAAAWASVLNQAVREMKTRQVTADSQREDAEHRAIHTEMLYRMILDAVPNGVVAFDTSGAVVTANPVARRLLGIDKTNAVEMPPTLASYLRSALNGSTPPYVETDLLVGHAVVPVGVQIRPLSVSTATPGAVMVVAELAELRRLQTRARLMEDLADLGQLTAGIAHEFRNASGTLRASAQFLADKVDGAAKEAVHDLLEETDKLARVTTELLDFAKPWDRGIESVELDPLIRQVSGQLGAAFPSHPVELRLTCPTRSVMGKGTLLARVIDNLIRNAAEANPPGAQIRVESSSTRDEGGSWLVVTVMDRGCGLAWGDAEEAFLPFRSTKPGGTGMGLTLARKIARLHGGTLTLTNRDGGGAVATLRLPFGDEEV
ncbi:PAS domain-containing protein [Candidatus Fermentibacteria bacterium]|nr:PAS domain-containing protein [Candidatus Fermentibacteria bacterium]